MVFLVENELIYTEPEKDLKEKVVIELEEIAEVLRQHHSNRMGRHSGINNTLSKIEILYVTWYES